VRMLSNAYQRNILDEMLSFVELCVECKVQEGGKGQWSMVGVLRPSRCELQMSGLAVVRSETSIDRTSCLRVECSREIDACRSVVVHTGGVRE
jgi:hypothetical protein